LEPGANSAFDDWRGGCNITAKLASDSFSVSPIQTGFIELLGSVLLTIGTSSSSSSSRILRLRSRGVLATLELWFSLASSLSLCANCCLDTVRYASKLDCTGTRGCRGGVVIDGVGFYGVGMLMMLFYCDFVVWSCMFNERRVLCVMVGDVMSALCAAWCGHLSISSNGHI